MLQSFTNKEVLRSFYLILLYWENSEEFEN